MERWSAGFSLACRGPHASNSQGPSQARAACRSRQGPGSSPSSPGLEVSDEMPPAGGGQLRDGDSCPLSLPARTGLLLPPEPRPPHPSWPTQGCVHPPPTPNPPAGIFPVLQAVGHIFQILGPLMLPPQIPRPPPPHPRHGKGRGARTLAHLGPGRGRSSWPGPAAVRCGGAKEKSPDYGGVMGKLQGDAPQTPPACSPVPLLHRISGL